jgi:hypothetical protein
LINNDDSKNIRSVSRFSEKIIKLKFRPKISGGSKNTLKELYDKNNHLAMSFNGGKLKVFHYESKSIIYEYKTTYGNIISLEYSSDGRLLSLGTENDNVYILDAENGGLLFCLEGHKNYITSIYFEEQITEEEPIDKNFTSENKNLYESNEFNYNSVSSAQKAHNLYNKELNPEDYLNLLVEENSLQGLDLRNLRRARTSININTGLIVDELRSSTTYDVYTGGLDGYLAVWRIEHFYEEGTFRKENYLNLPNSSQTIKLDQPNVLQLIPKESIKVENSWMEKINKAPLNHFYIFENILVFICKRNIYGSHCYLSFFQGTIKSDEIHLNNVTQNINNKDDPLKKQSDLDSKIEKLKSTGVSGRSILKTHNTNNSTQPMNTDTPVKDRKFNSSFISSPNQRRESNNQKDEFLMSSSGINAANDRRARSGSKK